MYLAGISPCPNHVRFRGVKRTLELECAISGCGKQILLLRAPKRHGNAAAALRGFPQLTAERVADLISPMARLVVKN
jgi:hypothetical protein